MNEQATMHNPNNAPVESVPVQPEVVEAAEEAKDLFKVRPEFFAPEDMAKAVEKITAINAGCSERSIPVLMGVPAEGPQSGFGIGIVPVTKLVKQRGRKLLSVVIGQVPAAASIASYADENHTKGPDFISGLIVKAVLGKLKAAFKPDSNDKVLGVFPDKLEQFLAVDRGEGLVTYREIGPGFVKVLNKMGMTSITVPLLRQLLESAPFAGQVYPNTDQSHWEKVLTRMIGYANKISLDPAILIHWKETRAETEADLGKFDDELFDKLMD